ncbi:uncharacterized protein PAC_17791 [Phialocephala subalpina]|uniref:Golgi apparatus membrane protein TVP38 n=1 Tax=Phialocephala subalpina TaxID=576137 RepID=A0A1L7XS50_9HELO|nr:uncharacterized protein PAC_17791 [Phialocephala subalpina]
MDHQPPHQQSHLPYSAEEDIGDAPRPPAVRLYDPPVEHSAPATTSTFAPPPPRQQLDPAYGGGTSKWEPNRTTAGSFIQGLKPKKKISKKWQRRLYWIVPLGIVAIVFAILFEVYKDDFEKWVKPLSDWLAAPSREAWTWVIPTAILVILSFPPLFGHEIVQLIVGLAYPLGVALGIACAGAVLGEAACFVVFKYFFTGWVEKKIDQKVNWAATARVAKEAGFRGVLVIRYSIVPPHLANPLFACTGMKFWLYMATVILSLPKSMVFVALGSPSSKNSKAAKYGKVLAIAVVVIITVFASVWIRKKMAIATREIMAERGISSSSDEELGMLTPNPEGTGTDDTSYKGANTPLSPPFPGYGNGGSGAEGSVMYQRPVSLPPDHTNTSTAYAGYQQPIPQDAGNSSYAPYRPDTVVEERPLGGQETGIVR